MKILIGISLIGGFALLGWGLPKFIYWAGTLPQDVIMLGFGASLGFWVFVNYLIAVAFKNS